MQVLLVEGQQDQGQCCKMCWVATMKFVIHPEQIQQPAQLVGQPLPPRYHSGSQQHINNSPQTPHQIARLSSVVFRSLARHCG